MIYLIRHAQKEDSSPNCGLTKNGILASRNYARKLLKNNAKLDFIISSPIKRCIQTANEISSIYNIEVIKSNKLGDPGVFISDDKVAMDIFNKYNLIDIINMQLEEKN